MNYQREMFILVSVLLCGLFAYNVSQTTELGIFWAPLTESPNAVIVSECLTDFILKACKHLDINYLLIYKGTTRETQRLLSDIINEILTRVQGTPVHVGRIGHFERFYNLHMRLLFIDSCDAVLDLLRHMPPSESKIVYYLVILIPPRNTVTDPVVAMERIFSSFLQLLFININIALPFEDGSIAIYTFIPYSPGDCSSTKPVLTHIFRTNGSMPALHDLFPPIKFYDFNGCSFSVLTTHIPPFIYLKRGKLGIDVISGIEGEIITAIADKLNFTLEVIGLNAKAAGSIDEDGMSANIFNALNRREANFTLGDTSCYSKRMRALTASKFYLQSIIRIAMKAGEPYSSIEVLFYPFQEKNWVYWLLLFCIRYAIIHFLYIYICKLPRPFRQFMLAMWLILIFFLRSAYEGSYFTYMHNRPLKPLPKYIEQLRDEKYTLISDKTTYYLLRENKELADIIATHLIDPKETYEMVETSIGKYGALTKKEYIAHYLREHQDKLPKFFMLHNHFVTDFLCIYFPRNSYLVKSFDDTIGRLRSFGLIRKFEKQFVDLKFLPAATSQRGIQRVSSELVRGLDFADLLGVFLLQIGLWLGAVFVFMLENLSLRYKGLQRLFT